MEITSFLASRKRSRSKSGDDFGDWQQGNELEWKKRPRNDTLVESTIDLKSIEPLNKPLEVQEEPVIMSRPPFNRAKTLPFRLPSYSFPESPASSVSSSSPNSIASPNSFASIPTCTELTEDEYMDTDMTLDSPPVHLPILPPPSSFKIPTRPPRLKQDSMLPPPSPHSQLSSGRIPTPIHPTFPTGSTSSSTSPFFNHHYGISSPVQPYIYSGHSPSRPIPSPIREDAMDTQLSKLSVSNESMDVDENSMLSPMSAGGSDGGQVPRKGRARSGAITTVNRRIFTGYVADCEKCRNKVPGHYIHFLP